jgi:Flp pilus assembly pilin Flp
VALKQAWISTRVRRLQAEDGQTIVEYGLILTFIALVVIAVLGGLGTQVVSSFTSASAGF